MAKQCDMCFNFKTPLVQVLPGCPAEVCKSCAYKINQVIGFLMYHEVSVTYQSQFFDTPPTPPKTPKKDKTDPDTTE